MAPAGPRKPPNGGEMALAEMTKRRPNLKNRVAPEVGKAVVAIAVEQPAWGQTRASNELKTRGVAVSPFGVRSIWIRHDLRTMKDRLKALEAKVAQTSEPVQRSGTRRRGAAARGGEGPKGQGVLTESQLAALEKAKADKGEAPRATGSSAAPNHGAFKSAPPGYCVAQYTFYVGTLKG